MFKKWRESTNKGADDFGVFVSEDNVPHRGSVLVDQFGFPLGFETSPISTKMVDADANQIGTISNPLETNASIPELFTIFNDILKEVKKINLQLAIITDNFITNQDVET